MVYIEQAYLPSLLYTLSDYKSLNQDTNSAVSRECNTYLILAMDCQLLHHNWWNLLQFSFF